MHLVCAMSALGEAWEWIWTHSCNVSISRHLFPKKKLKCTLRSCRRKSPEHPYDFNLGAIGRLLGVHNPPEIVLISESRTHCLDQISTGIWTVSMTHGWNGLHLQRRGTDFPEVMGVEGLESIGYCSHSQVVIHRQQLLQRFLLLLHNIAAPEEGMGTHPALGRHLLHQQNAFFPMGCARLKEKEET